MVKRLLVDNNKRENWIDIFKGIAMLMIVYQHASLFSVSIVFNFNSLIKLCLIEPFATSLFFCLNGYLFNVNKYLNMSFCEYLYYKVYKLLLPFIIITAIMLPIHLLYVFLKGAIIDYKLIIEYIVFVKFSPPLWFLLCIFWSNILFYIFAKIINFINTNLIAGRIWNLILLIILMIITDCLSFNKISFLPFRIELTFCGVLLMSIGKFINEIKLVDNISKAKVTHKVIYLLISLFLSLAIIWHNNKEFIVSIWSNKLPDIVLFSIENFIKFIYLFIYCLQFFNIF